MNRSLPEWIGMDQDAAIPLRVRMRVLERQDCKCARCVRDIRPGDLWICDHVIALCNGGMNRESNLQALCPACDGLKYRDDLSIKSKGYATRVAHFGQKESKWPPMPGTKRSRFKKKMDGRVEYRK